jgi:hypothetical protein
VALLIKINFLTYYFLKLINYHKPKNNTILMILRVIYLQRSALQLERRKLSRGFFGGLKDLLSGTNKDKAARTAGGVEVLTEEDQKKEQKRVLTNTIDNIVDDMFPKGKRGLVGSVISSVMKFAGKRVVAQMEKQAEVFNEISEDVMAKLRLDEYLISTLGDPRELEVVSLNQSVVNGKMQAQLGYSLSGTRGKGLVNVKVVNSVPTEISMHTSSQMCIKMS